MSVALALLAAATPAAPTTTWSAPSACLQGKSFTAHVEVTAPAEGAGIPTWMFAPSAFTVNGAPLAPREPGTLPLGPHGKAAFDVDLGVALANLKLDPAARFALAYEGDAKPMEIAFLVPADKALNFMDEAAVAPTTLASYWPVLETNRGTMIAQMWADVAPVNVRNFLDLCQTGFYDGLTFHRVIPGFMIQGGDPKGDGSGDGPRKTLKPEFSDRKHEAGVLSMARQGAQDPKEDEKFWNTASSQFFVMHATSPHLDGKYTAFGKLASGLDVVDKIVRAKRGPGDKPLEPQTIVKASVWRGPAN